MAGARMTIHVLKPGLSTTVQDRGRFGYAHLGISPCGAADALSLRIANRLAGNDEFAPALEMTLLGATLEFERSAIVAVSGANCDCKVGQYRVPHNAAVNIPAGGVLQCGSTVGGARSYLAVQGGLDVPLVMGSSSTDVRGGFGGMEGRRLQAGDVIRIGKADGRSPGRLRGGACDELVRSGPIRVTRGAQNDWFSPEAWATFLATAYSVSEQSDRAGLRLRGQPVNSREQRQMLTDGIPLGAVQIPQDGQPIILFVDQQTTGGYPKIANAVAADMHRIGQICPRDTLRFEEVPVADAIEALRAQQHWLAEIWRD
jgi:antagonist of KipI